VEVVDIERVTRLGRGGVLRDGEVPLKQYDDVGRGRVFALDSRDGSLTRA
jgi:hypothetical protein